MPELWIVHRDPRWRTALRRAAAAADAMAGDPADARAFRDAEPPRAVLLGLSGDYEAELEFAHRHAPRLGAVPWVLLAPGVEIPEAQRLFDAIPAAFVALTDDALELRRRLRAALGARTAASLSARARRDALAERFARWFGDLELPTLLAALDPARRAAPLLVRGEPGTGRGLLARYLHVSGGDAAAGPFLALVCRESLSAAALAGALVRETEGRGGAPHATVCVEDVQRLAPEAQDALRAWIEHGPPVGAIQAAEIRWIATADDPRDALEDDLDPGLARALAGLAVRLPPLRERPAAIDAVAAAALRAWARDRGGRGRALAPAAVAALHAEPWPGNLRELEAVLARTLAATDADPIGARDLVLEPPLATPGLRAPAAPFRREPEEAEAQPAPSAAPAPPTPPEPRGVAAAPSADLLKRLADAIAHEVGNPLVGIRTFAQMLARRFDDPDFRSQFSARVDADTQRIEEVLEALARLAALPPPALRPVDVSGLVAGLLELRRRPIEERRLVALEELDRDQPLALADADQLRLALEGLFDEALATVPDRGDLYVATRHHASGGPSGGPFLRLLVRFQSGEPGAPPRPDRLAPTEHALRVAIAEALVRAQGGVLTVEAAQPAETLVLIDLPAPPRG